MFHVYKYLIQMYGFHSIAQAKKCYCRIRGVNLSTNNSLWPAKGNTNGSPHRAFGHGTFGKTTT